MKLIELIIKHVPRDKIHPDAKFFAQDNYRSDKRLSQFKKMPAADGSGDWNDFSYITGSRIALPELAEDARYTVVTREQLGQLWNLQDQGYTLRFGAEPMPSGIWYEVHYYILSDDTVCPATKTSEGVITAYRPVKNVPRPRVENYEPDTTIATVIEANLKGRLATGVTDVTSFPRLEGEQVCFSLDGRVSANGDNLVIVTRKQWDDYISRKIRVGDKVKTQEGNVAEVLFMTETRAFIRYETDGSEAAYPLNYINRIPQ